MHQWRFWKTAASKDIVARAGRNETEGALGQRPERSNQRSAVEWLANAMLGSQTLAKPISQITDHWVRSFKPIEFEIPSWLEKFNRRQTELQAALTPGASWAIKTSTFALIQHIKLLNKAHWIAHPALPISDLIGEQSDPEKVGETVADYVEQHLQEIYQILESRFSSYNSAAETKVFALELVQAHRHGLFHLIVPAVFPEIERCARDVLGLGAGKKSKVVINALTMGIRSLSISEIGSLHALSALSMMDKYFYQSFRSESDADKFKGMIHRHGSQHGLLRYSESRHCLNAMFLFDFVLLGCDALRRP